MAPEEVHGLESETLYNVDAAWQIVQAGDDYTTESIETGRGGKPVYTMPFFIAVVRRVYVDGVVGGLYVAKKSPADPQLKFIYLSVRGIDGTTRGLARAREALGEPLTPKQSQSLIAWLGDAARVPAGTIPEEATISRPTWDGDTILIPGLTAQAEYGAISVPLPTGDPDEAAEAWREIIMLGAKYPKLGMLIGASIISPYLRRLGVSGSTWHSEADSTKFKTKGNEIAIAVWDDPRREGTPLRDSWDTTPVAFVRRASALNFLPLLLDETATATRNPEQLYKDVIFHVSDGHGRSRGQRDGTFNDDAPFCLNLLSTGEESLVDGSGATGSMARVHCIRFPLTDDPAEIAELDYAHARAIDRAGWPGWWLLQTPLPQRDDLRVPTLGHPLAQRHAEALAAARLGFRWLARVLGVEADLDLDEVVADLIEDVEKGAVWERVREKLWEHYVSHPNDYNNALGLRGASGYKRDDGTVAYFPETVKRVCIELRVSMDVALRDLRTYDVLIPASDGKNLARLVRPGAGANATRMYVLRDLYESEPTEATAFATSASS